jgi:hypothetical protein
MWSKYAGRADPKRQEIAEHAEHFCIYGLCENDLLLPPVMNMAVMGNITQELTHERLK